MSEPRDFDPSAEGEVEDLHRESVTAGATLVQAPASTTTAPDASAGLAPHAAPTALPAVVVAATGFAAGAAMVGLLRRRRTRGRRALNLGRRTSAAVPRGELVHVLATRSLLVDVHLLGGRD